jgi:transcriptional regulator with XRE-family HTH domain
MRDFISEENAKKLVRRLIRIRKDKKLSQYKIARISGLSTSGVSALEKGERNPSLVTCFKIARALDIKLWEILRDIEK